MIAEVLNQTINHKKRAYLDDPDAVRAKLSVWTGHSFDGEMFQDHYVVRTGINNYHVRAAHEGARYKSATVYRD